MLVAGWWILDSGRHELDSPTETFDARIVVWMGARIDGLMDLFKG